MGRQIEEVVVTAERRESTVQDPAISITAFAGEFIEDFGLRNQEDLQNRNKNRNKGTHEFGPTTDIRVTSS